MLAYSTDYNKQLFQRISLIEQEVMEQEEMYLFESLSLLHEGIIPKTANRIAKSTVNTVDSTLRGLGAGAKRYFDSFIAAIKGIFKRFIDNVTRLFKSQEKWLAQNESYIKNANLKGFLYEIFPYWENDAYAKRLAQTKITDMDIKNFNGKENLHEEVRQFYLKRAGLGNAKINTSDTDVFVSDLKVFFRGGGSRVIKENELRSKLSEIFDFCKGYGNSYKEINKSINDLTYTCNRAKRLYEVNNNALKDKAQGVDPNGAKENKLTKNESFIFTEEEKNLKDVATSKGKATNPTELGEKNKELEEKTEQQKRQEQEKAEEDTVKNTASESQGEMFKTTKIVLEVVTSFVTTQMSIMEEKFKIYMKLLRKVAHRSMGQSLDSKANGKSVVNGENIISKVSRKTEEVARKGGKVINNVKASIHTRRSERNK